MEALKRKIETEGVGIGTEVVKVDMFLNHKIDVALAVEMGQAFYEAFKDDQVDVIKVADWLIDLGPEGGDEGGTIVCAGTPETVAQCEGSYTGYFLKGLLTPEA